MNVSSSSSSFWCLAAALKQFIEQEGHGLLPLEVCPLLNCVPASFCLSQQHSRGVALVKVQSLVEALI